MSPAGSGCDHALTYLQTRYSVFHNAVAAANATLLAASTAKDQARANLDAAQAALDPMRETCRPYETVTYTPSLDPSSSASDVETNIAGVTRVSGTQKFKAAFEQEVKNPLHEEDTMYNMLTLQHEGKDHEEDAVLGVLAPKR